MSRDTWADYWTDGGRRRSVGCLPDAGPEVDALLGGIWREFGATLRRRAKVLDLATGDGAVPRALKAARPDLDLVGVDSAPIPPSGAGIRLQGGVAMEQLPFAVASYDAVTSQFGIEYGDTALICAEVARLLKPLGTIRFVIHHAQSAIVAHNRGRRAALAWAIECPALEKARRLAEARQSARLPTPAAFVQFVGEARRVHPDQPVAAEFLTAILQTLRMGETRPPRETIEVLTSLRSKGKSEIGRIDALQAAARDEVSVGQVASELERSGLRLLKPRELIVRADLAPLAWLIDGAKPAK
jgi:SAM-dependent methyltransferase